jgi:hypothetical protein
MKQIWLKIPTAWIVLLVFFISVFTKRYQADLYDPQQLIGRQVIAIANFTQTDRLFSANT